MIKLGNKKATGIYYIITRTSYDKDGKFVYFHRITKTYYEIGYDGRFLKGYLVIYPLLKKVEFQEGEKIKESILIHKNLKHYCIRNIAKEKSSRPLFICPKTEIKEHVNNTNKIFRSRLTCKRYIVQNKETRKISLAIYAKSCGLRYFDNLLLVDLNKNWIYDI